MESVISYTLTRNEITATNQLLGGGHRLDKRDFFGAREMRVKLNEGSSVIYLGKTIVSCHTTAVEEVPDENRPNEGLFSLSITSPYKLDNQFRIETLRAIKAAFIKTKALDLESLVIKIGVSVYHLNSEIVILENDGGIVDASNAALAMSLISLHVPGTRGPRPITLHHLPLSVTFSIFTPEILITDPTLLEAAVCKSTITIFANANGFVCGLSKNGGTPLPSSAIVSLMQQAIDISTEWHTQLMHQMGDNAPPNLKKIASDKLKETNKKIIQEEKREIGETENANENVENRENNEEKQETHEEEEEEVGVDPQLLAFLGIA